MKSTFLVVRGVNDTVEQKYFDLKLEYSANSDLYMYETALTRGSGVRSELFARKTSSRKSRDRVPLRPMYKSTPPRTPGKP
jgi:hypothetical protein